MRERVLRYLLLFWPKNGRQWMWTILYLLLFYICVFPQLQNAFGYFLLFLGAGFFITGALIVPVTAIELWEKLPYQFRGLVFAAAAYLITVSLGFVGTGKTPQGWWELVFLQGNAPFSSVHTAGFLAMIPAWCVQRYREDPHKEQFEGKETFLRGTPDIISRDEAFAKLEQLASVVGWD